MLHRCRAAVILKGRAPPRVAQSRTFAPGGRDTMTIVLHEIGKDLKLAIMEAARD
jgi:hypothetical protein